MRESKFINIIFIIMKNIETQYRSLVKELLGAPFKPDRTGTGTYSLFGKTLEHDMSAGFPLLLSKKVFISSDRLSYARY